jgi:hypothetical protein
MDRLIEAPDAVFAEPLFPTDSCGRRATDGYLHPLKFNKGYGSHGSVAVIPENETMRSGRLNSLLCVILCGFEFSRTGILQGGGNTRVPAGRELFKNAN